MSTPKQLPRIPLHIAQYLSSHNLTCQEIANQSNGEVAASQVWRVLAGESLPSLRTLRVMAEVMELSLEEITGLLNLTDPPSTGG